MPFYIREEKYCPTCGLPTDQCECLAYPNDIDGEDDEDLEDLEDEDYL